MINDARLMETGLREEVVDFPGIFNTNGNTDSNLKILVMTTGRR